jgi:hypothetical protein
MPFDIQPWSFTPTGLNGLSEKLIVSHLIVSHHDKTALVPSSV